MYPDSWAFAALQVFLEYADVEGSTKAKTGMHGRKFGGNQVVAVFYPEDKFAAEQYDWVVETILELQLHHTMWYFFKFFDRTRAVIPIGFESYLVEFRAEPVYI